MPVLRQGIETADSGRVQQLIENDQRRNATVFIAENAVRHLAETHQSQKSVTHTCGNSRGARSESHAPRSLVSAIRVAVDIGAIFGYIVCTRHNDWCSMHHLTGPQFLD